MPTAGSRQVLGNSSRVANILTLMLMLLLLLDSRLDRAILAARALNALPLRALLAPKSTSSTSNSLRPLKAHFSSTTPTTTTATTTANSTSQALSVRRKPDSSSSFFAKIEDLDDSSIRTRLATLEQPAELLNNANPLQVSSSQQSRLDFELIIERILQSQHEQWSTLNNTNSSNKTSMRFFRNNKTFASIVFTNLQPRRLINCHLVDLEKHSADVALFEAKYLIRAVDVEFPQMMQLIECCTDIARFKPFRPSLGGRPNAVQLFAASLPAHQSKFSAHQKRPLLVVGRPVPAPIAVQQSTDTRLVRRSQTFPEPRAAIKNPVKALVRDAKRLVLGEVTPPASLAQARPGAIKDALQEISSYDTSDLLAIWRGILPGTNWCGMGDRATSYNDLGFESDIDICCRAHDFCPIRLSAFSSGYGLFNWSFYTRSHCTCDQNFLDCLSRAESPLSAVVTKFYFNIMKTTCLHDNETRLSPPNSNARQASQSLARPQQLLDQIRHSLPIPALQKSQLVAHLKLDNKPPLASGNLKRYTPSD